MKIHNQDIYEKNNLRFNPLWIKGDFDEIEFKPDLYYMIINGRKDRYGMSLPEARQTLLSCLRLQNESVDMVMQNKQFQALSKNEFSLIVKGDNPYKIIEKYEGIVPIEKFYRFYKVLMNNALLYNIDEEFKLYSTICKHYVRLMYI